MIFDRTGLHFNIPDRDIIQIGDERSIISTDINYKLCQYKLPTQTVSRISVEQLLEIKFSDANFIVTVENQQLRSDAIQYINKKAWNQISIIMENCSIMPDVDVGIGTAIFPMNVILSETTIGNNVLIYPACAIGHRVTIGNNTLIQSGSFVGGSTLIGDNCQVGLRATIATHVNLPANSTIGGFSSLTKSPESSGVFVGTPARKVNQ
jgi:UDP-3-O-[3-hydroxymyristoyl] glucosamine N-acyltransferase